MKVLRINALYGINSTGTTVKELHLALQTNGIESFVAAPIFIGTTTNDKHFYKIGNILDRKIHALLSRVFGKQGYYSILSTIRLLHWIKLIKPDIIHLHNLHSNYINVGILLKYCACNKIPVILTLHDCWFFTGKCVYYTEFGCSKWKYHCGNCPALHSGNNSWIFDKSSQMLKDKCSWFSRIDMLYVIGVSKWITEESQQSSILKNASKHLCIYNWINQSIFYPRQTLLRAKLLKDKYSHIILASAWTWNTEKGLNDIIKISQLIESNIVFVLIGEIDADICLPNNIVSVGRVMEQNRLAEYYSAADVFVHLSIRETFGKVTAEALSCGTPVVVYDSTASPELVTPATGRVVKIGDTAGVIDALYELIKIGKKNISDACVLFANENFNITVNINKYMELYKKIYRDIKRRRYNE